MGAAAAAFNATLYASSKVRAGQSAQAVVLKNLATIALLLTANQQARSSRLDAAVTVPQAAVEKTPSGGDFGYIPLGYKDAPDRNGRYYLPPGYDSSPIPVMVILHGSGQDGTMMGRYFSWLADKYRFAIVAPDSQDHVQWRMANANQPLTLDWNHIQASYQYVTQLPGVRASKDKVLYAGFSRGGYSAIALASRLGFITHSLVMHSDAIPAQLGWHRLPAHFSTGSRDPLFTPARVQKTVDMLNSKGFPTTLSVYPTGHSLSSSKELEDGITWWLGT